MFLFLLSHLNFFEIFQTGFPPSLLKVFEMKNITAFAMRALGLSCLAESIKASSRIFLFSAIKRLLPLPLFALYGAPVHYL